MDLSVEGKSERIPPGSHICQLYSKVTEIPGVTARLMKVGLSVSEKCLFAAAPAQVKELRDELSARAYRIPKSKTATFHRRQTSRPIRV